MTDFRAKQASNGFDNLSINLNTLYQTWPITDKTPQHASWFPSPFHRLYQAPVFSLRVRRYLWEAARRSHLDQTWFESFKTYWSHILGGRPLWGVQDFYFLRGLYRIRFQNSQIPDTTDAAIHLQAWQQPEVMYQLLHLVYRESLAPALRELQLADKYCSYQWQRMLEFGAGSAPITTTLFEFNAKAQQKKVYISDIQTLAFHYGAYKFRSAPRVEPILLRPENQFQLELAEPVDVIYCITVFEHLNQPLETIRRFWASLRPGGVLIFDYIKSEGGGLDTHHAVKERSAVLDFIANHFTVVYGRLDHTRSLPITVARKK
jgi:2-polyprenyl-3-methyl-5-hydroxy-6-metoxy-1,4-benzoquinol methylase